MNKLLEKYAEIFVGTRMVLYKETSELMKLFDLTLKQARY